MTNITDMVPLAEVLRVESMLNKQADTTRHLQQKLMFQSVAQDFKSLHQGACWCMVRCRLLLHSYGFCKFAKDHQISVRVVVVRLIAFSMPSAIIASEI